MKYHISERSFWIDKILPITMEYGIYMLAVFLFLDKGESFRSFGLYVPPGALVIRVILTRKWPFEWRNPLFLSLMAFFVSIVIASLLSSESLEYLFWIKSTYLKVLLMFLVIITGFKRPDVLKRLIMLLSLISVIFIAMTFYDYTTKVLTDNDEILFSNIRNYNPILAFLLPLVPFAILTAENLFKKCIWIFVLCMGFTALLLTGFRGGWVSVFVSMVIWIVWFSFNIRKRAVILILVVIAVAVSSLLTFLPSSHIATKLRQGLSTTNRYEWIWKPYIHLYNEFPLANKVFGSGMTREAMMKYHDRYRQESGNIPDEDIPLNTHDHYLYVLFQQGILGLALYLNLIIVYLVLIIKAIKTRTLFENKAMGIAVLCPFVGEYIVHGLVEDLRIMPLGLLLGMAGAYVNLAEDNKDKSTA